MSNGNQYEKSKSFGVKKKYFFLMCFFYFRNGKFLRQKKVPNSLYPRVPPKKKYDILSKVMTRHIIHTGKEWVKVTSSNRIKNF